MCHPNLTDIGLNLYLYIVVSLVGFVSLPPLVGSENSVPWAESVYGLQWLECEVSPTGLWFINDSFPSGWHYYKLL